MDLVDTLILQNKDNVRIISVIEHQYIAFNPIEISKLISEDDAFLRGMRVKLIMRYMKDNGIIKGTKTVSVKYRMKGKITPAKNRFKVFLVSKGVLSC